MAAPRQKRKNRLDKSVTESCSGEKAVAVNLTVVSIVSPGEEDWELG